MSLRAYYNDGSYLEEHADYFKNSNPKKDALFLIKALDLKKSSLILDVACGQGRHIEELIRLGYLVDGVDFSASLLRIAKDRVKGVSGYEPDFFCSSIESFVSEKKYNVAYWFFSDLAEVSMHEALKSLYGALKRGGRLLLDTDSVFRLVRYMQDHDQKNLSFDASNLELVDKENDVSMTYMAVPQWRELLASEGFRLEAVYGDYKKNKYTVSSKRLILVANKSARAK